MKFIVIGLAFIISMYPAVFENLDFEDANVSVVPAGSAGDPVPVEEAFPGWRVYSGGATNSRAVMVLHNTRTIAFKAIAIYGPDATNEIFGGKYTAWFKSHEFAETFRPSLCQVGRIPSGANSLLFSFIGDNLQVTFSGKRLAISILQHRERYWIMGADISEIAGQTGELCFTAGTDEHPVGGGYLDDIRFSEVIGEPRLFIEQKEDGLKLLWPLWAKEFDLEASEGDFAKWAKVEAIAVPEGLFSTMTLSPTNRMTYFRLRRS